MGGSGESQLESDRRLFRKQIGRIEAEMEEVRSQRDFYRSKRRERDSLPVVAIVGYTNAGKSTLLNQLCGSQEVYADNLLFATLDPTVRKVNLPGGKEVLLSDTVGFIQKLPTKLVPAFRATLEELEDASLVIHVVDAASPLGKQQVWSVQTIIDECNASSLPQVLVLNKADVSLANEGELPKGREWAQIHEKVIPAHTVCTSAKHGNGLKKLLETVEKVLLDLDKRVEVLLPYSAGELLGEVHKVGTIESEEFEERGTRIVAHVPPSLFNRLAPYVEGKSAKKAPPPPVESG